MAPTCSVALLFAVLAGCTTTPLKLEELRVLSQSSDKTTFFYFDSSGSLINPDQLVDLRATLSGGVEIKSINVVAFGWNRTPRESVAEYTHFIRKNVIYSFPQDSHTIFIVWDSASRSFQQLFESFLPLRLLTPIGRSFDEITFPLTFWAKSAEASRVGAGIRRILSDLHDEVASLRGRGFSVRFLSHSLGARIVTSVFTEPVSGFPPSALGTAFPIQSAILLQPAITNAELPDPDFPIVVTQSIHDYAAERIFPIANLISNSALTSIVQGYSEENGLSHTIIEDPIYWALGVPFSAFAVVTTLPLQAAANLLTHPTACLLNTLEQVPVIQIAPRVARTAGVLGRAPDGKGLLTLTIMHESMGSPNQDMLRGRGWTYLSLSDITDSDFERHLKEGRLIVVDCSNVIRTSSLFRVDLSDPLASSTLGWLDPIGAHSDFWHRPVYDLIKRVASFGPAPSPTEDKNAPSRTTPGGESGTPVGTSLSNTEDTR